jgi:hypothetical protein
MIQTACPKVNKPAKGMLKNIVRKMNAKKSVRLTQKLNLMPSFIPTANGGKRNARMMRSTVLIKEYIRKW